MLHLASIEIWLIHKNYICVQVHHVEGVKDTVFGIIFCK
jgi:hypothetical protein